MESSTADHAETPLEEDVGAQTVIEAFHNTVARERRRRSPIRTQGDEFEITWSELQRPRRRARRGPVEARPQAAATRSR